MMSESEKEAFLKAIDNEYLSEDEWSPYYYGDYKLIKRDRVSDIFEHKETRHRVHADNL